jgi:hypothetical protein
MALSNLTSDQNQIRSLLALHLLNFLHRPKSLLHNLLIVNAVSLELQVIEMKDCSPSTVCSQKTLH